MVFRVSGASVIHYRPDSIQLIGTHETTLLAMLFYFLY